MKYEELVILLPCHSLEDFPQYYEGDEAEGLLASWSALWHPALIHSVGRLPTWYRADSPPENLERRLIVVPQVSESLLLAGWSQRAKNEGACVIRKKTKRADIVAAALAELDTGQIAHWLFGPHWIWGGLMSAVTVGILLWSLRDALPVSFSLS